MVLMSEIFPYKLRATAMSFGLFLNRLMSGVVASSFLSLMHIFSAPGTFILFGIISTGVFFFVYVKVPETMGRSLEEMHDFFAGLVNDEAAGGGVALHVELEELETPRGL